MRKTSINLKNLSFNLFLGIILFIYLTPHYFLPIQINFGGTYTTFSVVIAYIRLGLLFLLMFVYIAKKIKLKSYLISFFCWVAYCSISFLLIAEKEYMYNHFSDLINLLGIVIVLHLFSEININKLLTVLYTLLLLYAFLTAFEQFTSRAGSADISGWIRVSLFIGIRTRIPDVCFPLICIALLLSIKKHKKYITKYSIVAFFISFYLIFKYSVSTGIIGLFLLIILLFLFNIKNNIYIEKVLRPNKKTTFKYEIKERMVLKYIFLGLAMNYLVIYIRIQNIFSFIIEDFLNKSLTFTGRTYIWDVAIPKIKENIFFGVGRRNGFVGYIPQLYQEAEGHSNFIQLIYDLGLIGFFLYIIFILLCFKKLDSYKKSKECVIMLSFLIVFLFMSITEVYWDKSYFYIIPILAANIEKLKE